MADVTLSWNTETASLDWGFVDGDLATGNDLVTAVALSLFTDRTASPGFTPPDGTNDSRGWWGDAYSSSPIGSRLWQLERSKKANAGGVLLQARDYARESLEWLIEDGVAASVDVKTQWVTPTMLGIQVAITQPDRTQLTFRYQWAWGS